METTMQKAMEEDEFDILEYLCEGGSDEHSVKDVIPTSFEKCCFDFGGEIDSFIARELNLPETFVKRSSSAPSKASFCAQLSADESGSSPPQDSSPSSDYSSDGAKFEKRCPVCGGNKVGKHLYYGARVCVGCRGFFQRAVQGGRHQLLACKAVGGQCPADVSKTGKTCKRCRFSRCLYAGMRTAWVQTEAERKERMMHRRESKTHALVRNSDLAGVFTADEERQLERRHLEFVDVGNARYFEHFATDHALFFAFVDFMLRRRRITADMYRACSALDEQATTNFVFALPEMSALSPFDRMSLVAGNFGAMCGVDYAACFTFKDVREYLRSFVEFGRRNRESNRDIDNLMSKLDLEDRTKDTRVLDEQDYVLGEYIDLSKRPEYEEILGQINPWIRKNGSTELDNVVLFLLVMISLFSPGSIVLESRKTVEEVQNRFVWQLQRYLRTKYSSESAKRLHQSLMVLVHAQRLFEIQRKISNDI